MIKVEEFSNADELELFIGTHNIKREDIIDIKWTATGHYVYGLLIYETNEVYVSPSLNYNDLEFIL